MRYLIALAVVTAALPAEAQKPSNPSGGESAEMNAAMRCPMKKKNKVEYCGKCAQFVTAKAELEKGKHVACGEKVEKIEACDMIFYECPTCKDRKMEKGKCANADCKSADRVETRSLARVMFGCEGGCGAKTVEKKKCEADTCPGKGKNFTPMCERNGEWPHVGKP